VGTPDDAKPRRGSAPKLLTTAGSLIGVVAGAAGLLFLFAPDLRPCIGDKSGSFVDAPVVPRVSFRDHLIRGGEPYASARKQPDILGAEVRFTFKTQGFRGEELPITYSLFEVDRSGVLGGVVVGHDRAPAMTVKSSHCGDSGGYDLFIQVPERNTRYRVLLELFRDDALNDRLDLMETDAFRG
jgi:hypothetical protein